MNETTRSVLKKARDLLFGRPRGDYREYLFGELERALGPVRPKRILEIGPKDGQDTRRLLTLQPERLTLVDLPRMAAQNAAWLGGLAAPQLEYLSANFLYSEEVARLPPFGVVWCTGVLYHNPEQLRMIRRLYDLLLPEGLLVLESATVRTARLRRLNVVEILYPSTDELKRRHRVSANVTHLPSALAIRSWLRMVGFDPVLESDCHPRISGARARVAYLARKPEQPRDGAYYDFDGSPGFPIGKAL
jgi:SAM-dependent methyltransferase